jgi:hypothetical protein
VSIRKNCGFSIIFKMFVGLYIYQKMVVFLLFSKCSLVSMLVCLYEKIVVFLLFSKRSLVFMLCLYKKIGGFFYYFQNVRWFLCWCVYTKTCR